MLTELTIGFFSGFSLGVILVVLVFQRDKKAPCSKCGHVEGQK